LFKLFPGHGEDCALYEVGRNAGESNVAVTRSATARHKILILDPNHRQAVSDQNVRLTFQPAAKRGELNRLGLQSSI
jgi:hypothetical protein